jgi:ech hydrogenase subunit D
MHLDAIAVTPRDLVGETAKLKAEGYRLITLSCVELDQGMVDLLYHFDRNLELKHLRMSVSRSSPVPSISSVYFAAFLAENEIQDLFGLRFEGLAIDYKGTFYLDEEVKSVPFARAEPNRASEE